MFRASATLTVALLVTTLTGRLLAQEHIPWITDLRQARQIAEQQQRLVLLHFWSESCPPCRALEQNVFNQPELVRVMSMSFVPVKINVLQQRKYAEFYKIDRVPTDIVVDPSGRELYRATSPQNMDGYLAMLDQVRAQSGVNPSRTLEALAQNKLGQFKSQLPPLPGATSEQEQSDSVNGDPQAAFQESESWQNVPGDAIKNLALAQKPQKSLVPNEFSMHARQTSQQTVEPAASRTYGELSAPTIDANRGSTMVDRPTGVAGVRNTNPYFQASASTSVGNAKSDLGKTDLEPIPAEEAMTEAPAVPVTNQDTLYNTHSSSTSNSSSSTQTASQFGGSTGAETGNVALKPNHVADPSGLTMPEQQPALPPNTPPLALDGYCPVTLVMMSKWEKGDPRFGAIHRGRTYLLGSQADQQRFLSDPDRFSPALSGYDPVRFAETRQLVEGKREHGLFLTDSNSYYLFADETTLAKFERQPVGYVNVVRQAMNSGRPNVPQR